jgi:2-phosphosulfolactate phosphatase
MMELSLYTQPSDFPEGLAKGKHIVVVDVLRASSTIVHACENGVERIIPVAQVEDATKLVPTLDRKKTLLGGERDGVKIDGFDLGNSPSEYVGRIVKGKTLIFSTSNGTVAITKSAPAAEILIGCFLNLSAVVRQLASSRASQVAILCAGNQGQLSLEDFVCGGCIVDRLASDSHSGTKLNDGAVAARALAASFGDAGEVVRQSSHGVLLAELGFEEDLEFCSRIDKYGTVPIVVDGRISPQNSVNR